jgi:very-short-patch-repair endonuclease
MHPEIQRARELRSNMSEPEVMLWSRLKRLRERGYRFRRQLPFRGYYLDFVCLSRRMVIEVDGFQHGEDTQAEHDAIRDRILQRQGFRVLRFWAGEVRRDLGGAMDQIVRALEEAPSTRLPSLNGQGQLAAGERGGGVATKLRLATLAHPSPP